MQEWTNTNRQEALCTTNTVKPFPPHHAPFETGSRKRSGLFVINESIFALCISTRLLPTPHGTGYQLQNPKRLSSRRGMYKIHVKEDSAIAGSSLHELCSILWFSRYTSIPVELELIVEIDKIYAIGTITSLMTMFKCQ